MKVDIETEDGFQWWIEITNFPEFLVDQEWFMVKTLKKGLSISDYNDPMTWKEFNDLFEERYAHPNSLVGMLRNIAKGEAIEP